MCNAQAARLGRVANPFRFRVHRNVCQPQARVFDNDPQRVCPNGSGGPSANGVDCIRRSPIEPQEGFLSIGGQQRTVFGEYVTAPEATTVGHQRTVLT